MSFPRLCSNLSMSLLFFPRAFSSAVRFPAQGATFPIFVCVCRRGLDAHAIECYCSKRQGSADDECCGVLTRERHNAANNALRKQVVPDFAQLKQGKTFSVAIHCMSLSCPCQQSDTLTTFAANGKGTNQRSPNVSQIGFTGLWISSLRYNEAAGEPIPVLSNRLTCNHQRCPPVMPPLRSVVSKIARVSHYSSRGG